MSGLAVIDQRGDSRAPAARGAGEGVSVGLDGVKLDLYDSLDAVESEWRQFEQTAECTPFQCFDWLATWCREVGWRTQTRPAIVVGRGADGTPFFILPLAMTPGAVSRLTWLGSDLSDYNGPLLAKNFAALIAPGQFAELWRRIRQLLQDRPLLRHDLIELTKMPAMVGGQANPFMTLPVGLNPSHAWVSDLFGTWDSFYQTKRSSATRRRDRTKLKRLAEFGAIGFVAPDEAGEIAHTMDVLAEQKMRSLARMGAPNIFARPGWREFYKAVATHPRMRDMVHVSRLDAGPVFTAINLGLVHRDSYYHVLVSHDDGETSRFGPGVAHLRELMGFAIGRGLKHFDFTIGDERYKLEWADHKVPLYDHVAAATLRGVVVRPLVVAARRIKRLVKQNATLWSLFCRLRAARGSGSAKDAGADVQKSPPIAPQ